MMIMIIIIIIIINIIIILLIYLGICQQRVTYNRLQSIQD
jgi:hypothetical protein